MMGYGTKSQHGIAAFQVEADKLGYGTKGQHGRAAFQVEADKLGYGTKGEGCGVARADGTFVKKLGVIKGPQPSKDCGTHVHVMSSIPLSSRLRFSLVPRPPRSLQPPRALPA